MNAFVHPLKRKKPGRKKGPPTDTITIRVSEGHKQKFNEDVPKKERRQWMEKRIGTPNTPTPARRNGQRGGRPKQNKST